MAHQGSEDLIETDKYEGCEQLEILDICTKKVK